MDPGGVAQRVWVPRAGTPGEGFNNAGYNQILEQSRWCENGVREIGGVAGQSFVVLPM